MTGYHFHGAGCIFSERLPHSRLQRKSLVSDPGMHHGTCVTHVPWCISGSLTHGGWENVPGACAILNFTYLARGPWLWTHEYSYTGTPSNYCVGPSDYKTLCMIEPSGTLAVSFWPSESARTKSRPHHGWTQGSIAQDAFRIHGMLSWISLGSLWVGPDLSKSERWRAVFVYHRLARLAARCHPCNGSRLLGWAQGQFYCHHHLRYRCVSRR